MAKLYTEKELADYFRKANPGAEYDAMSDSAVLGVAAELPGGKEFLARLKPKEAPPPVEKKSFFSKARDLAAAVKSKITSEEIRQKIKK